jgi:hypothetical protein
VYALEVLEVDATAVSHAAHLLIILFVGEGQGDLVVEVEDGPDGEVGQPLLEEAGDLLGNSVLHLLLNIVPQFVDE